jgi:hypothetical protein
MELISSGVGKEMELIRNGMGCGDVLKGLVSNEMGCGKEMKGMKSGMAG